MIFFHKFINIISYAGNSLCSIDIFIVIDRNVYGPNDIHTFDRTISIVPTILTTAYMFNHHMLINISFVHFCSKFAPFCSVIVGIWHYYCCIWNYKIWMGLVMILKKTIYFIWQFFLGSGFTGRLKFARFFLCAMSSEATERQLSPSINDYHPLSWTSNS